MNRKEWRQKTLFDWAVRSADSGKRWCAATYGAYQLTEEQALLLLDDADYDIVKAVVFRKDFSPSPKTITKIINLDFPELLLELLSKNGMSFSESQLDKGQTHWHPDVAKAFFQEKTKRDKTCLWERITHCLPPARKRATL